MKKRVIISVGREFGSGGHVIAEELSKRFSLPLYDHVLLEQIAQEKNMDRKHLEKYDERPVNKFLSRTVRGHSSSLQDHVAQFQFDFLRKKADAGESFVVVGRCSEDILKNYDGIITIFILGDEEVKRKRVMEVYKLSAEDAGYMMTRKDWKRKSYHNYYCKGKWGDSRYYDVSINSSKLGIDKTVNLLEEYIRERMVEMES